jgi:transketolase
MTTTADELKVDDFIARGAAAQEMPRAYGDALLEAAARDPRIVALCADLTASTETDRFRDAHPARFVHTGIAEANMVGMAAGMARSGHIAFTHTFSVFATRRSYDQIAMQVAYPRTDVKMVGFLPGLTTLLGVSHQAIDDVALMRALPNMTIAEPAGPEQMKAIVEAACARPGPVYLRMRRAAWATRPELQDARFEFGKGTLLREGGDGVIFAAGLMVEHALAASDLLAAEGLQVAVANLASIKPLDTALVLAEARRSGIVVTAENHSVIGGLGSAVAECLAEAGVPARLARIGLQDTFAEGGTLAFLLQKYGMDADAIAAAVRRLRSERR